MIVFSAMLITACGGKVTVPLTLVDPSVEMQDGSRPLATNEPRFSWHYSSTAKNVMQQSYRIVVASTEQKARNGEGDLWDSEVVSSNQMLYIPYEGVALQSRDCCYWKVFTTVSCGDNGRSIKLESDVESFEISLLERDDWKAHWIGRDYPDDILEGHTAIAARYLRTEFRTNPNTSNPDISNPNISKARLYISGLGVYSVYINGNEVAPDELLKPTASDYTQRIYFNAYDVTEMLREGDVNAIGVILEGGRFTTMRHDNKYIEWCWLHHVAHYGLPQLLLQLEVTYADGSTDTIVSGQGWRITNQGPIRKSNEFDGETYDARMQLGDWTLPNYDDTSWDSAVVDYDRQNMYIEDRYNPRHRADKGEWPVKSIGSGGYLPSEYPVPDPMQLLSPQPNPNIKVQAQIKPIGILRKDDTWILDMGQNMVGVLSATLSDMQCGDTITFRFAETLRADSSLYTDNLRSAECTDRYIANGPQAEWHPMFTYHGFRYVEIRGLRREPRASDFTGLVFYDEMATTGSFSCSNEVINAVYRNASWGIRGNYRSMPTDCPQRDERMGWTGDRTTGCYGESYLFNNHQLYAKWLQDLADSQFDNGSISDVAPAYWRNYTDNMTWPGAFITAADMIYSRFGDIRPIQQHYDAMKRWMLHMKKYYLKDGILIRDTYGDWCVPPESPELIHTKDTNRMTWPGNLSTPYYVHYANIMANFAQLLGRTDDIDLWQDDIALVTQANNSHYLDTATGRYDHNTVTANILPLAFGMVPEGLEEKVFLNIVEKTENEFGGHISTGVVGIQHLMRTLTKYGRGDLALRLATNTTYPSWGYMVSKGATTIWELWNGDTGDPAMNSGNHVMLLGDLLLWEYEYLAGIRALEPGYSVIELKPYPIEGLDYVNCTFNSVSGRIESNWKRSGNSFEWDILIPANTTAEVYLPTKDGYQKQTLCSGRHHLKSILGNL